MPWKIRTRTPRRAAHVPRARLRLAAALFSVVLPGTALAGSFAVMSYDVQGLPSPPLADRTEQMSAIAPLLEDFHDPLGTYPGIKSLVGLQETFDEKYYDILTEQATVSYPYVSMKDTGGMAMLGGGLNFLSDFNVDDLVRTKWGTCNGDLGGFEGDCDTSKGFTYARMFLEGSVSVDLYMLHADAGDEQDDYLSRQANILELAAAINMNSPEGTPVIVLGNTNGHYTRIPKDNLQRLLSETGIHDVWVELRRAGVIPVAGADIDADCATDPGTGECELVDKIFYRDGNSLVLAPQSYAVLKGLFSDGMGGDLSDHYPVAVTFDYAVVTTTTTLPMSTSTSTSTTTMPADRPCGDPLGLFVALSDTGLDDTGESRAIVAGDALIVLRAAVGTSDCALCTCDVNSSGNILASDALLVLKHAVGQDVPLNCPLC